jgi:hypothetical protein
MTYNVGPCHHGMARPQTADGRDGLLLWRVAENILSKQLRTKGWSSSLGVGGGANNPCRRENNLLRNVTKGLGFGRILWKDIRIGKWISDLEREMLAVSTGYI